jgi:hypothetical protein
MRTTTRRDGVETLWARLDLLGEEDKALLEIYLEANASLEALARLAGTSRSAMCRRIHRLIRRLSDPTYARCATAPGTFSPAELAVLRDHFVRGLPLTRICRNQRLVYYRARALVLKARRLARERRRSEETAACAASP